MKIQKNGLYANNGWFYRLKHRFGIRLSTQVGEKFFYDFDDVERYKNTFLKTIDELWLYHS